jgi:uncharacterized membrane protein YfcA
VVLAFGLPGAVAAYFGARLLKALGTFPALTEFEMGGRVCTVTPLGVIIGVLVVFFACFELHPVAKKLQLPPRYLPLGGLLSGFLGGLSGHQGALRTTFMVRLGLSKQAFLGTGIVCAVIIDIVRISVYAFDMFGDAEGAQDFKSLADGWHYVGAGTGAAFIGSYVGRRLIDKVTMEGIRLLVGVMLLCLGIAIAAGIV